MLSSLPYRIRPSDPALGEISLRDLPGVSLREMSRLAGSVCADMYGDFPYGLLVLSDGEVRGAAGSIYTKDGRPILEQNAVFLRKGKFIRPRYESSLDLTCRTRQYQDLLSLLSRCHNCFWHWMGDSLPKVLIAEECGFQGTYLIPPPEVAPWALESMRLVGIAPERVAMNNDQIVTAERLYIPTYFCGYNAHFNRAFVRIFREWVRGFIPHREGAARKRTLVGRRSTAKARRVVNHVHVERAAQEFGFTTIYFEDLPLREQLILARETEVLMGPHSSGLTHLLFMDENTLVIELFPFQKQQSCDCYETLAMVTPHRYRFLESDPPCDGDIEVNVDMLQALLRTELGTSAL